MNSKVVIIGAGAVGATTAYALMISGLVAEIGLIDANKEKARGEALDLGHSASFVKPTRVYSGDYDICANADVIIITAGAAQKEGETRLDLAVKNAAIMQEIIPQILAYNTEAILVIASNPVDILTYITQEIAGLPYNQVLGSGTMLDTSRFRYFISNHCRVDPRNVHTYVIGEHGDTAVPIWSNATIGGILLDDFCWGKGIICSEEWKEDTTLKLKDAAYEVISLKGATYYAIGLALKRLVEAILRNDHAIITVSTRINNFYDINENCFSIPCLVGNEGVHRSLPLKLNQTEVELLHRSAQTLRHKIDELAIKNTTSPL